MIPKIRDRTNLGNMANTIMTFLPSTTMTTTTITKIPRDRFGETMDYLMENHRWAAYTLAAVALAAPNVLAASARISRRKQAQLSKARGRLVAQGYVLLANGPGGKRYVLTKKGECKLAAFLLYLPQRKLKRRWDRRWRVLLYDVPEKQRRQRNRLRHLVRLFGCFQLQKNVWLYPYSDIQELVDYLHLIYGQGEAALLYLEAKRFADDQTAATYFGLN